MTQDDAFAADLLRGHTDTIVLGVLRRGDRYGFEIYKSIRDATGGGHEIKEATLYATYRRLEKDGLVESYWGDETQGGRRKYYRITDAGRARYRGNVAAWVATRRIIDSLLDIKSTDVKEPRIMSTDIHRLLDEAFAGVEMTPDAQDLKEESAPTSSPASPSSRPRGDRRRMPRARRSPSSATSATCSTGPERRRRPRAADSYAALQLRHRVRPKAGFVVRVVVWSLAFIVGMTLAILGATGVLPLPIGAIIGLMGFASTGLGLVVGDSLSQETTTNHPMPPNRAGGYFLATLLGIVRTRLRRAGRAGRAADVVRRLRGAWRDRLDHPLRVPRRVADQSPQGVGASGAARCVAGRQPVRGGARDRRPLRHLHGGDLDS